ncbi:hypothetical protein [Bradyrhizobium sp. NP1]|uniref:hypothetical protein n=1 Tax=Bradyrhizobium sp. NP1 TaxID=3049772 RepID=UPI0025A56871|nr:hypothetical protein [Bradyrhizobium sp. NP1]WJR81512.1 hypothetical protein QOU61_17730 [Bradyrhizobium sp. NP1]
MDETMNVPVQTGVADLKFLRRVPQARLGNFRPGSGTRIMDFPVPFASRRS